MVKDILQKEERVLREIAEPVPIEDIGTPKINKIISEMKEALESQDDGVAIAAPQIGYSLQIFVVSKRVEEIINEAKRNKSEMEDELGEDETKPKNLNAKDVVFINPVMKKLSKERKTVEEGCLSVRYLYGQVRRSTKATVEALDESGKKFQRGGTGLIAQIFQHEMDHLDGVLFIDKAQNVEEIFPEKLKKEKNDKR
jgi:peptide deformylase